MVEPVPRPFDAHGRGMAKGPVAAIVGGIARAALLPIQEKRRTGDAGPEGLDVPAAHVVREPRAHVIVELPAVRPVLVLVHAVAGEVTGLLDREMRVLLLHAAKGILDGGVAAGQPARQATFLAYPLVHPLRDGLRSV